MKLVSINIELEVDDDITKEQVQALVSNLENECIKQNYEIYDACYTLEENDEEDS